jgi:thiamine-phosphate pyrophosphorylase
VLAPTGAAGRVMRGPRCMLVVSAGDVRERAAAIVAALAGGVDTVQLRDRGATGGALYTAALTLRAWTRRTGAALLVNDRLDVARAVGAEGAQLPAASFPIDAARAILGPTAWIGRSTHAPAEAVAAAREGASFVVLGPIFATPSKRAYGAPLGTAALVATPLAVPLIAIGGITAERVAEVRRAGASGVAVIRAIVDAPDPTAAARSLMAAVSR